MPILTADGVVIAGAMIPFNFKIEMSLEHDVLTLLVPKMDPTPRVFIVDNDTTSGINRLGAILYNDWRIWGDFNDEALSEDGRRFKAALVSIFSSRPSADSDKKG